MDSNKEIEQTINALAKLSILSSSNWVVTIFNGSECVSQYFTKGIYSASNYIEQQFSDDTHFVLARVGARGIFYRDTESKKAILLEPYVKTKKSEEKEKSRRK